MLMTLAALLVLVLFPEAIVMIMGISLVAMR
jgi:hypothetical protein